MTAVAIIGPGDGELIVNGPSTKLDRNHPEHFQDAASDLAPGSEVRILTTGQVLKL